MTQNNGEQVNTLHNGADPTYQTRLGGGAKVGATGAALGMLAREAILMNWWYGWDPSVQTKGTLLFTPSISPLATSFSVF